MNWALKNLLGAGIFTVVVVTGAYIGLNRLTKHNQEIEVPDFTNMSLAEAGKLAAANSVYLEVTDSVYVRRMNKGAIYRQNPKPHSKVKEGRRILLTINAVNAKKVKMPNLIGYSMRQAKAELASKGLVLGDLIYVEDMATNNVLRQLKGKREVEPGSFIESGSVIDLVVGLDAKDNLTLIPDILGLKNMSAVDAIHDNSLNVRKLVFDNSVKDYSDSLSAVVYRQSPEPSEHSVPMGSDVTIYLTTDQHKVPKK